MIFIGCLINFAAVLLGGALGGLVRRGLPTRINESLLHGMGLCVVLIGLQDIVSYVTEYCTRADVGSYHILIPILSLAGGIAIGEALQLEKRVNDLGQLLLNKIGQGEKTRTLQGFVNATILFCVGAMAIVASVRAGLLGEQAMLITKAVIDGISAFVLAGSMGFGVCLSAVMVLLYQGGITAVSYLVGHAVVDGNATEMAAALAEMPAIREMTCVGALMIIVIGTNMLGATRVRVANFVPALLLPFLLCLFL